VHEPGGNWKEDLKDINIIINNINNNIRLGLFLHLLNTWPLTLHTHRYRQGNNMHTLLPRIRRRLMDIEWDQVITWDRRPCRLPMDQVFILRRTDIHPEFRQQLLLLNPVN
jgi:hypothetical protein